MYYAIDLYARYWRSNGYKVIDHVGPNSLPAADAIILHVDKTDVPSEYRSLQKGYPKVVNGRALDISRRSFSQLLLSPTDNYKGPVIIKTNANYGGWPEHVLHRKFSWKTKIHQCSNMRAIPNSVMPNKMTAKYDWKTFSSHKFISSAIHRFMSVFNKLLPNNESNRWKKTFSLNPLRYPIFESIANVPRGVWQNDQLIVERFLPDYEEGLFHTNYYCFFGDKELCGRIGAPDPIVKFGNCETEDLSTTVPDVVRQWRKSLNIDFGRFDYVQHAGEYYLIDVNKTEGGGHGNQQYVDEMHFLASGLDSFLDV